MGRFLCRLNKLDVKFWLFPPASIPYTKLSQQAQHSIAYSHESGIIDCFKLLLQYTHGVCMLREHWLWRNPHCEIYSKIQPKLMASVWVNKMKKIFYSYCVCFFLEGILKRSPQTVFTCWAVVEGYLLVFSCRFLVSAEVCFSFEQCFL